MQQRIPNLCDRGFNTGGDTDRGNPTETLVVFISSATSKTCDINCCI